MTTRAQPLFVGGDVDGFFGLAIDNLIQFLLVLLLCTAVLEFPVELVLDTVLPGAAMSVLVGNLFYSWQAQRLSAKTGRKDVTALPYGINTVSLFAYVFLVMLPVKLAAMEQGLDNAAAASQTVKDIEGKIASLGTLHELATTTEERLNAEMGRLELRLRAAEGLVTRIRLLLIEEDDHERNRASTAFSHR